MPSASPPTARTTCSGPPRRWATRAVGLDITICRATVHLSIKPATPTQLWLDSITIQLSGTRPMNSQIPLSDKRGTNQAATKRRLAAAIAAIAALAWTSGISFTAAADLPAVTEQIRQSRLFTEPLVWTGETPPGEAESAAL